MSSKSSPAWYAIIVGNYLTTLGRPAHRDIAMLDELKMPIKALSETL